MFYQNFEPNDHLYPWIDFQIKVNSIEICDNFFIEHEITKEFIDWNELIFTAELRSTMKFEAEPLFVMSFGVQSRSINFKRIDYNFLDLLGDVGGVIDSLFIIGSII